jgi:hypothetical protein
VRRFFTLSTTGARLKKFLVATAVVLGTLTLSGCQYFYPNWGATSAPTGTPTASPTSEPTASETSEPSPSASASQKPKSQVGLRVLSSVADAGAGQITVIAEVADISEDGGSCTLKVTSGSVTKTLTVKAESNVTDTQCYPFNLPLTGIPSGNASFTVSYESADSIGATGANSLVIP